LALSLGLQTEGLARALDSQDLGLVKALAGRLEATAAKGGAIQVESVAGTLRDLSENDGDLSTIVETMHELIDLCRTAQQAHIETDADFALVDAARRRSVALASTST
jgi:hypothetical protein